MATNNCVYETFFDSRSTNDRCPYFNQVDFLINHPVLQKINVSRSVDHFQRCLPQCADDDKSWLQSPVNSTCSSVSSLRTVCSLEESQQQQQQQVHDIGRVPRLRHSASVHHQVQRPSKFSLNLSPKLRSKFCEILSPISDKSQEIGENESSTVLIKSVPVERTTRPKSLFSHVTESSTGGFNSSDSGISISAHSLLSHDALQFKQTHVSLDNAQGTVKHFINTVSQTAIDRNQWPIMSSTINCTCVEMLDREDEKEESLPFIMPKLHRGKMPSNRPGRSLVGLSLSLPFPSKNPINTVPLSAILSDIVDEGISLHSQT